MMKPMITPRGNDRPTHSSAFKPTLLPARDTDLSQQTKAEHAATASQLNSIAADIAQRIR